MTMPSESASQVSKSMPEEVGEVFPLAGYLLKHFFQTIAIVIPMIGFLGYAIGRSFYDGWDEAAGIPTTLFPVDAYALVLQGMKLPEPWYWALACAAFLFLLIKLSVMFDISMSHLADIRHKQALLRAKREWPRGKHHLAWKERKRKIKRSIDAPATQQHRKYRLSYVLTILTTFMVLVAMVVPIPIYQMLKISFLNRSHAAGVSQYVGIHMLVTGKVPTRYGKIPKEKFLEYVCEAKKGMWKYRAITLKDMSAKNDMASPPIIGYILRSAGDVFLLLTAEGTIIKSYGGNGFEIHESEDRPTSSIGDGCPIS